MRLVFSFIFIFILLLPFITLAQPSGWKLARDTNGVKVWLLEKNPDITGSLVIRKEQNKINGLIIKGDKLFQDFENKKKKMLTYIGVNDWKASNYEWFPDKRELFVEGTYRDSYGHLIVFAEIQSFKDEESIQILHTRPLSIIDGKKYEQEILSFMKAQVGSR